jgi:hypothetical protein
MRDESDENCFGGVYVAWRQMAETSQTCLRLHLRLHSGTCSENRLFAEQTAQSELRVALTEAELSSILIQSNSGFLLL